MVWTIGVLAENAPERRVALTPDGVQRLRKAGHQALVQSGAGAAAWFPDDAYVSAGAQIVAAEKVLAQADIIACIAPPGPPERQLLRPGQLVVGLLQPLINAELAHELAAAKVTAVSLDGLPRTLSRAQAMDVLSSQANVAGYKAALVAADAYGGYFPMLMTAAGTTRPARVLVIGAGVAGLQAIGTARRLGAMVTGYDIRDAARADVLSTGAGFLELEGLPQLGRQAGGDGYARELTGAEREAQQAALDAAIGRFDIVITTAQVPGRRPPLLVRAAALQQLQPGAVVVDLASGPLGGNVEGSVPEQTVHTPGGVTIIGAGSLPSQVPKAASTAYSRNIVALVAYLIPGDDLVLNLSDEVIAGVLVCHDGELVHPDVEVPQ